MKLPEEYIDSGTLFLRNVDKPFLVASFISALANNSEGGRLIIGVKSKLELSFIDIAETKNALTYIIDHYLNKKPFYTIEEINISGNVLILVNIQTANFICKVKEREGQKAYLINKGEIFEMNKILYQFQLKTKEGNLDLYPGTDIIMEEMCKRIKHAGSLTLSQAYTLFQEEEKKTIDRVLVNLLLLDKIKYEYIALQTKFKINC